MIPQSALTESEALRSLNLPSSRRAWLREKLNAIHVGPTIIYDAAQVEALRACGVENREPVTATSRKTSGTIENRDFHSTPENRAILTENQ